MELTLEGTKANNTQTYTMKYKKSMNTYIHTYDFLYLKYRSFLCSSAPCEDYVLNVNFRESLLIMITIY